MNSRPCILYTFRFHNSYAFVYTTTSYHDIPYVSCIMYHEHQLFHFLIRFALHHNKLRRTT